MSAETGLLVRVFAGPYADGTETPRAYVVTNIPGPFQVSDDTPAAVLVHRRIAGKDVFHVEPVAEVPAGSVGYMASGRYVEGDSRLSERVGFYGAVVLHNRVETFAQYEELSR